MRRPIAMALLPLALAVSAFAPEPASADPICVGVVIDTSATSPLPIGPFCVPYSGQVNCQVISGGVAPPLDVDVLVCVPHP